MRRYVPLATPPLQDPAVMMKVPISGVPAADEILDVEYLPETETAAETRAIREAFGQVKPGQAERPVRSPGPHPARR